MELIEKQQAIDAVTNELDMIDHVPQWVFDRLEKRLKQLPPAKLGTNLAEVGTDCISRQAAIDALKNDMASLDHIIKGMSANDVRLDAYVSQRNQVNYDIYTINNLPPARPETATVSVGISRGGVTMWYECDACGEPVDQGDIFCSGCGRKLIHE